MKNGWDELSGALFAELKRLGDTSLSTDELKTEIDRAKAVSNVSQQILTGVSLAIETQKVIGEYDSAKNVKVPKFFLEEKKMPKVKYRRLTEDEEKFIKRYAAGHSREEITNALNKKFQTDVPKWKVEYFCLITKLLQGYTTGHKYSKDEICFLEAYAPSHSLNEIQIAFNDKFKLNIKKKVP